MSTISIHDSPPRRFQVVDLARIRMLRDSLLDCEIAVDDARTDFVTALETRDWLAEADILADADRAVREAVALRDRVADALAAALNGRAA